MVGPSQPAESRVKILEDENNFSIARYRKSRDFIRLAPRIGYGNVAVSAFNHRAFVELRGDIVVPSAR